ncbi:hypothetical protein K457DRAFT_1885350 [Linnemannia elongata AG-77]|uniref:Uncharacterized protein n=1 Tax=Linnemannia elongata AG-77 TaxID=1314771 RepID=A0A197JEU2_9FUNG|nr:hypothetical protein K457DRAFT_1885350 [Linnemannia elongata AG-77]
MIDETNKHTPGYDLFMLSSENGTFELAITRAFRQAMFSKSYRPPTSAPHHPPMVAPPPPLTATFWSSFWKNKIRTTRPLFPDPDPVKPLYDIPIFILIGTILASVWRYHHAFVREDQAFEPRMVLAAVDLAIIQVRAQLAEKKRQNEEREPHPQSTTPLSTTTSPPNLYFISYLSVLNLLDLSCFL